MSLLDKAAERISTVERQVRMELAALIESIEFIDTGFEPHDESGKTGTLTISKLTGDFCLDPFTYNIQLQKELLRETLLKKQGISEFIRMVNILVDATHTVPPYTIQIGSTRFRFHPLFVEELKKVFFIDEG